MNSGNFESEYSRNTGGGRGRHNYEGYQSYQGQQSRNTKSGLGHQGYRKQRDGQRMQGSFTSATTSERYKNSSTQQSTLSLGQQQQYKGEQENIAKIELLKVQQSQSMNIMSDMPPLKKNLSNQASQGPYPRASNNNSSGSLLQGPSHGAQQKKPVVLQHKFGQTPVPKLVLAQESQGYNLSQQSTPSMTMRQPMSQQMPLFTPEAACLIQTPSSHSSSALDSAQQQQQLPLHSMFSTPKVDLRYRNQLDHPMTFKCLRKCAQWNVAIKLNNKKIIKVPHSAIAVRQNGSLQGGPVPFTNDILDALIEKETLLQCTQAPPFTAQASNYQEQHQQPLHLKHFNGFFSKVSHEMPVSLPLNNQGCESQSQCIDLLKHQMSEQMFCLEFDLSALELFSLSPPNSNQASSGSENQPGEGEEDPTNLRIINQKLVESTIHFFINASCHGSRVLAQDLHFQLQGKKIIKSVQQRIIDYKSFIQNQVYLKLFELSQECKCFSSQHYYQGGQQNSRYFRGGSNGYCRHQELQHIVKQLEQGLSSEAAGGSHLRTCLQYMRQLNDQGYGPTLKRTSTLHAKMVNMTKSIGVEVNFANLPCIEGFLTNFNQIVLQEGIINKFLFCFDLPLSKLSQSCLLPLPSQVPLTFSPTTILQPYILKDCSNNSQQTYVLHQNQPSHEDKVIKPMNLLEEFQKSKIESQIRSILSTSSAQSNNDTLDLDEDEAESKSFTNLPVLSLSQKSSHQTASRSSTRSIQDISSETQEYLPAAQENLSKSEVTPVGQSTQIGPFTYQQQVPFSNPIANPGQTAIFPAQLQQQPIIFLSQQQMQFQQYPMAPIQYQMVPTGFPQAAFYYQPAQALTMPVYQSILTYSQQPQAQIQPNAFPLSFKQQQKVAASQRIDNLTSTMPIQSNLDRLLEFTTPHVDVVPTYQQLASGMSRYPGGSLSLSTKQTLEEFFSQFQEASYFGLKALLFNQISSNKEQYVLVPTLSSLSLKYFTGKPQAVSSPQIKETAYLFDELNFGRSLSSATETGGESLQPKLIDFNSIGLDHQKSISSQNSVLSLDSVNLDLITLSKADTATEPGSQTLRCYEFHEDQPVYMRSPFSETVDQILAGKHHPLKTLTMDCIDTSTSWFAVVWSVLKKTHMQADLTLQNQLKNQQSSSQSIGLNSVATGQQFLMVYRFEELKMLRESEGRAQVCLVGLVPLKAEDEYYWISPIDSNSDYLERQNRRELTALKDQAVNFYEEEGQRTYDYNLFVHSSSTYYDQL